MSSQPTQKINPKPSPIPEVLILDMSPAQWVTFHNLCDRYEIESNESHDAPKDTRNNTAETPVDDITWMMRAGAAAVANPLSGPTSWFPVILEATQDAEHVVLRGTLTVETTADGWGRVRGVTAWSRLIAGTTLQAGVYAALATLWQTESNLWVTVVPE